MGAAVVLLAIHGVGNRIVSPARIEIIPPSPPIQSISLPVQTAVCSYRPSACVVLVAVHVSVLGSYLPPVFNRLPLLYPPQTKSFSLRSRLPCERIGSRRVGGADGSPTVCARIVSPPVFKPLMRSVVPPQTIISLPVTRSGEHFGHRARW